MHPIVPIIASVINSLVPAQQQAFTRRETEPEALIRYQDIARDLAMTVGTEPSLYDGDNGKVRTMATMLAIVAKESGFRKDVDKGGTRGDGGESWCLAQINLPGQSRIVVRADGSMAYSTTEGWSGKDLTADRRKCFRAQLAVLRMSFACPSRDELGRLSLYASGSCTRGHAASATRMRLAETVAKRLTFADSDIGEFLVWRD